MSLEERARRERFLERAAATAAACRKCPIGFERRHNVYGEGDPCARLMVIGEGPGETEDLLGRPFVGRAGELLDKMLASVFRRADRRDRAASYPGARSSGRKIVPRRYLQHYEVARHLV